MDGVKTVLQPTCRGARPVVASLFGVDMLSEFSTDNSEPKEMLFDSEPKEMLFRSLCGRYLKFGLARSLRLSTINYSNKLAENISTLNQLP